MANACIIPATDSHKKHITQDNEVLYILPFKLTSRNIQIIIFPKGKELSTAKCPKPLITETSYLLEHRKISSVGIKNKR